MKYEHMDIIFLEAAGGRRRNPKLTLSFDQFLVALLKTAAKKYPTEKTAEAFNLLLTQCILPFANREAGEGGHSLRLQPSVASVLTSNQQLLELIFAFYTDLDIDPRTSADHLKVAICCLDAYNHTPELTIDVVCRMRSPCHLGNSLSGPKTSS